MKYSIITDLEMIMEVFKNGNISTFVNLNDQTAKKIALLKISAIHAKRT